jgi:hypothetical protein
MPRIEADTITNTLHRMVHETIDSVHTTGSLFASFFEGKLKKAGVRLSDSERRRVREAADEYMRTNDLSVFASAIKRKRNINIEITDADLERFTERVTKAHEEHIGIAIQKFARMRAQAAAAWADLEVEWTKAIREGFESRLARTWRKPLRLYARFLRLVAYVGELATEHINEQQLLVSSRLAKALLMLHARAFAIAGEIETLIRSGYPDGAAARWRTLHEISVTAAFLVEHGEDAAARYLDHFTCEQLKSARFYEQHRQALGEDPLDPGFIKTLEDEVDALKKQYGDAFRHDNGWAAHTLQLKKVNFTDIESAVKLDFMRPYYRGASEQVHASSRGAVMRSGLINQHSTVDKLVAGPSSYGFADAAINSTRSLLMTTISLTRVAPTVDTSVYSIVLGKWLDPLARSFVETQRGIEQREERCRDKPRSMRRVRLPSAARRGNQRGKQAKGNQESRG